jgi:hypothetical protein
VAVSDKGVTVELKDKRQRILLAGDPMLRRMDLGYALNAHMAQSITKDEAIQAISAYQRNLATQRSENVLATRTMNDLHVVTDNGVDLEKQLDRTRGNKNSAIETVGKLDVDPQKVGSPIKNMRETLAMSDAWRDKLAAVPTPPDRTNTLPLPEKQLGLEL